MDENVIEVLNNQLPTYFRPIIEFQEILKAHGYALKQINRIATHMQDNFYLATCDEQTLDYYEKLMGISGKKGLLLDERRAIVLAQYSMRPVYTIQTLKELLSSIIGADNYAVECLYEKYQIIVKIIGQDLQKTKGIYDIIFFINPAHIELLVYAEYREEAEIEIKQAVGMEFRIRFYPQFNLPELFLDGSWELDGNQTLGGYDGNERIDLYPVELEVQTKTAGVLQEKPGIIFLMKVKEGIINKQEIELQISAVYHGTTEESIAMQASTGVKTGTGEIFMDNQNFLDGKWELDGSRELNGGEYQW